ncbi:MAG TPA: hypothetical protein VKS82_16620 [Streptosporangiaceae bacterium]|nr:hypothetical protein [Streptosporangiaceae bacterium]
MLLVVVGLLVLVLVILVVVFLSVRSMRDAEEDDYEDRPAPRRPARGGRDDEDARPRGASRSRPPRSPARRGPAPESWQNDRDAGYAHSAADYEDDPVPAQRRGPALPRPRGYQHDQDRQETPRRAARSQPRQAAARLTGGDRDRTGKDWSETDWGGVSDEQYWAELSSDKPLATTARSAQPASADRAATTTMATVLPVPERPAEPRTFGDPPSMQSHSRLAGRPGAAESNDTDPGLGSQAGWPGRADDSASTATWTVAGTGSTHDWAPQEPQDESWGPHDPPAVSSTGWHDPGEPATAAWTAQDAAVVSGANWADEPSAADWGEPEHSSPAWNGDHATPAWNDDRRLARSWNFTEDPLTSPSFSTADGYDSDGSAVTDSRSYRRPHDRARAQYDSSPDVLGGAQPDYAGSHSNGDGYSASWPGAGDDFSPGSHDPLEPLPELGGSPAASSQSWHQAPVSAGDSRFHAEPTAQSWDQAGPGYDDTARHRSGRQSPDDGYSSQDYRDWQGPDAGYQQPAGYEPSHSHRHSNGYRNYEPGYGSTAGYGADHADGGYGPNGNGYSLPARGSGPAMNGYGHERGHDQHSEYDSDRWQ